jgi:excisionase family DNA binding protein
MENEMNVSKSTSTAPAIDAEKLLTTEEVAIWLGIKKCTLEKARSTRVGDLPPFIRVGRTVRYSREAVSAWLAAHTFNVDGSPLQSGAKK